MVSSEESGIDFNATDARCRDAETECHCVERGWVVTTRLPAVVPGAGVGECILLLNGRRGGDEVFCCREEFVCAVQDLGS